MTTKGSARGQLEILQQQRFQTLGLRRPAPQDVESLVRSHLRELPLENPNLTSEEIEAYARRKIEKVQALLQESPPTRFEDLTTYINILVVADELEQGARRADKSVKVTRPIFGTLPGGAVNALTLREGNEYIVAFSRGLFAFANIMADSVVSTVPYGGMKTGIPGTGPGLPMHEFPLRLEDVRESLAHNPEGVKCFTEAILSYVRFGRPEVSTMPWLDRARVGFASMLSRSVLEFVVAHEYGHILNNHLMDLGGPSRGDGGAVAGVSWNWKQETEADVTACRLVFVSHINEPTNLTVILMGIQVFLSCYEIVDRALSLLSVGDDEYTDFTERHPPAQTRRRFLHNHLISRSGDFLRDSDADVRMRSALKDANDLAQIIDLFWELARPYVWQLYERGCAPHPIFRRVSDAKQPRDAAMLGEARQQLKELFPVVHETLEKTEELVVAGKRFVRTCSTTLLCEGSSPGLSHAQVADALAAISNGWTELGRILRFQVQPLSHLRSALIPAPAIPLELFQVVLGRLSLSGDRLEAAGEPTGNAVIGLREAGQLIHQAGDLLSSMGEASGLATHLCQIGDCLSAAGNALARGDTKAYCKLAKLAGLIAVLSGECLIRGVIGLWMDWLVPRMGGALVGVAYALRQSRNPPLWSVRRVLGEYKEPVYAMARSMRRSGSFLRNVVLPASDDEARFRLAAGILKTRANKLGNIFAHVSEAESVIDQGRLNGPEPSLSGIGSLLSSAAKSLGAAGAIEEELGLASGLGDLSRVLSFAGFHLANQDPLLASQAMEGLAVRLLQRTPR